MAGRSPTSRHCSTGILSRKNFPRFDRQVGREAKIRPPVYTIGHSTRTVDEFVGLLGAGSVKLVVDVRTVPRSRTNPQYNADTFPATLAARHISYMRIADLGGLRKRSADVPPEVNGYWENQSFHNYADYALSDQFSRAIDDLEEQANRKAAAIMCSEAVWWRCHRRIIADYLILRGRQVFHLMNSDRADPARMTPAAVVEGGHLIYPAKVCIAKV